MKTTIVETFRLASREADPYLLREWIVALAWIYSTYVFYMGGQSFDLAIATGFALPLLLYAAAVSGLMGRSIETGQFSHLWTLPLSRGFSIIGRLGGYVLPLAGLIVLPLVFLCVWASFPPSLEGIVPAFTLLVSTLMLYVSVGSLVAAATKNSVATFAMVFFPFLILPSYIATQFPSDTTALGAIGGLDVLTLSVSTTVLVNIFAVQIAGSWVAVGCSYAILRLSNLRSGR
jgi:hypothetical protein